jgi:hypothetical protein
MFGFGLIQEKRGIADGLPMLTRAFTVQCQELMPSTGSKIVLDWLPWETFAFVCWIFHIGIQNVQKSQRAKLQLMQYLSEQANSSIFRELSSNVHWAESSQDKKAFHIKILNNLEKRCLEYNDEFNRGKIQILLSDDDMFLPDRFLLNLEVILFLEIDSIRIRYTLEC